VLSTYDTIRDGIWDLNMKTVLISGSGGLIGSEAVSFFCDRGFRAIGLDNNMRRVYFGEEACTQWNSRRLIEKYPEQYIHYDIDVRDRNAVERLFRENGDQLDLVIHAAAQPSHDWAAGDPYTDFTVNAIGTLTMLESTRQFCSDATFIFCSTNKVYGNRPNSLPLTEMEYRWEIERGHPCYLGIDETMSIDNCQHSLFGASKAAADILVQEYGQYFGMKTAVFRGGCLTGPSHSGTKLHGFLSYLMKCTMTGAPYQVFGYKGKQVRDNIHSYDLVNAFYHFYSAPRVGEVYNIGGGRFSSCSILEAIKLCEVIADKKLAWAYQEASRTGDHIWWITDVGKFRNHYPAWNLSYTTQDILTEIYSANSSRW
jgi:CDP-paratose 2-epimerase